MVLLTLPIVGQAVPLAIAFLNVGGAFAPRLIAWPRARCRDTQVPPTLKGSGAYRAVVSSKSTLKSFAVSMLMMKLCSFWHCSLPMMSPPSGLRHLDARRDSE